MQIKQDKIGRHFWQGLVYNEYQIGVAVQPLAGVVGHPCWRFTLRV